MGASHLSGPLTVGGLAVGMGGLQLPVTGQVFHYDPANGADGRDGTSRANAKATLNAAIGLCVADRGDVIIAYPGGEEVTEVVDFNVRGITVVASQFGSPAEEAAESFTIYADASYTDGPAGIIHDPVRLIGLGFAGRQSNGENLLVDCEEAGGFNGGFNELIGCRFPQWYGNVDYGLRFIGGAINKVRSCSFDGLFGGFGDGAIAFDNDGAITPAYVEVTDCRFHGIGSGVHAIVHKTGSTPLSFYYARNLLLPGFLGNGGKFLENSGVTSTGAIVDNVLHGLANKAAAFENLGSASILFRNIYDADT